jgi:putative phage-type endonuclease
MSLSVEQLAVRRGRITGTTAAAIIGVSPFLSAHDAWMDIRGHRAFEPTERMRWGIALQPAVAAEFSRRHELRTIACEATRVHPERDWLAATGDYFLYDYDEPAGLLEVKTAGWDRRDEWAPSGTALPPLHYYVQLVVQMAVYGEREAWLAVLIGGNEYREYRVAREEPVERELLDRLAAWHREYVAEDREPPATTRERLEWLEAKYPRQTEPEVSAPPEAARWVEQWRAARRGIRFATEQAETARAELCALLGEAEAMHGDGWLVEWKAPRPARITDWEAVARAAGASTDSIHEHTAERASSRRFRVRIDKEVSDE